LRLRPEGPDLHNRRSSTCGKLYPNFFLIYNLCF
jgi:hypothetical protein